LNNPNRTAASSNGPSGGLVHEAINLSGRGVTVLVGARIPESFASRSSRRSDI
jgi:hypothetical protein